MAVYSWQAAFVAYCNGAPEEEISQIFDIPEGTLRNRMVMENWRKLRDEVLVCRAGQESALPAKVDAKLKLIQENRAENLKVFGKLREHLLKVVTALAEGTGEAPGLALEKQWHNKGSVVRAAVAPGPGDWVNIATYARTVAEGTYRALGDFAAQEKPGSDAPTGAAPPTAPAITIILPAAIAAPRQERVIEEDKPGQVIDLTQVASGDAGAEKPE